MLRLSRDTSSGALFIKVNSKYLILKGFHNVVLRLRVFTLVEGDNNQGNSRVSFRENHKKFCGG